jgi:hypothetical protein
MRDILRMKKPINAFVSSDKGTEKNNENDRHTGQIFHAAIAEGKPFSGTLSYEKKCDAQWYSCRRVSKIMDSVCQQTHASRDHDHRELHYSGNRERNERPFQRTEAFSSCGYRRINNAMAVAMPGSVTVTRTGCIGVMMMWHGISSAYTA